MNRIPIAASLALALACQRAAPPSPQYADAREKLLQIRKEKLDEAYFDDRIPEVLELLAEVHPQSVDGPAARQLKQDIEAARAERAKQLDEEAKLIERIRAPPPASFAASPSAPSPQLQPVAAAAPDAGPPTDPQAGMSESEFKSRFSGCFSFARPFMSATGQNGEAWSLKDIAACRDRHRASVGKIVLLSKGQVVGIVAEKDAPVAEYTLVDGRLVPADQVPPAPKAVDAGPPPAPEE